ncbi:MAG: CHAT domain-containing protein [Lewinellaceae bacterium]|nr:CHAT domain-containing protein [Lewinellaceae bacterium]
MKRFFFFLAMAFFCTGSWGQDIRDTAWARVLVEEAAELINAREYEEAMGKLDTAGQVYKQMIGTENVLFAEVLHQKGATLYKMGVFDEAKKNYLAALEIRQKILGAEHPKVAKSLNNLGNVSRTEGDYEKATDYYKRALEILQKALGPNHTDVAISLVNFGIVFYDKGEYDNAIEHYQRALEIFQLTFGKQHPYVITTLKNLGLCYSGSGEYNKAIGFYQNALDICETVFGHEHPTIAEFFNSLGVVFDLKGDLNQAVECYQKALKIGKKTLGDDNLTVASALANLGILFARKNDFEKSIEYNEKALEIIKKIFGEKHHVVAQSLNNLGVIFRDKGEPKKALEHFQKALSIQQEVFGNKHSVIASSFSNLGLALTDIGQYEAAIANHMRSIEISNEVLGPGHINTAVYYNNLGYVYSKLANYEEAIKCYGKALEIEQKIPDLKSNSVSVSLFGLAHCYFQKKQNENIDSILNQVLEKLNFSDPALVYQVNNISILIKTLSFRGNLLRTRYHSLNEHQYLLEAQKAYDVFDRVVHYQRRNLTEGSKGIFSREILSGYEGMIATNYNFFQININQTYLETAFKINEKSKSLLLYESLQETDALNYANIPDSLLQQEYGLRVDITFYDKQRQEKLTQGLSETDTTVLAISSKLFDLNREYEALKTHFEQNYPDYYRLKYDLSTVTIEEVQRELLRPNQTLLEYFVGDSSIFLFVIKQDDYQVVEVKKDFPLDSLVRQVRDGITGYYGGDERTEARLQQTITQYAEAAQELYRRLLAPAEGLLSESLVIVPDGILGYVPFEALLSGPVEDIADFGAYPYLLKKHRISYCYSATLLREMQQKQHRKEPERTLLAFAPFYEQSYEYLQDLFGNVLDARVAALDTAGWVSTRRDFSPLPASGEEVYTASRLWEGDYFLNADATEERFTELVSDYRILHLSTHGIADSRVGDYSYLAFAEVPDSVENELLYVRDLYNLQLNADLVVLSACETGVGELQRGEGIISLARAFAYAGAKSIVTSLWVANDSSTKELMNAFYVQLRKGLGKDEALRAAKLHYLEEFPGERAHPFFWAGFVGVGDMEAVR